MEQQLKKKSIKQWGWLDRVFLVLAKLKQVEQSRYTEDMEAIKEWDRMLMETQTAK